MTDISYRSAYKLMLREYPDILSFEQMCEVLKISPKTGYKILKNKKIECIKVGKAYRIPKVHLLNYLLHSGKTSDPFGS